MSLTATGESLALIASAADSFAGFDAVFPPGTRGDQVFAGLEGLPAATQQEGDLAGLLPLRQPSTCACQENGHVPPQEMPVLGTDFSTVWLSEVARTTAPSGEMDAIWVSSFSDPVRRPPTTAATARAVRDTAERALEVEGTAGIRQSALLAEDPADSEPKAAGFRAAPDAAAVPDPFPQAGMTVARPAMQGGELAPESLREVVAKDELGTREQNSAPKGKTNGPSRFVASDLLLTRPAEQQLPFAMTDSPAEPTIRPEATEPREGVSAGSVLAVASGPEPLALREAPRGRSAQVSAPEETMAAPAQVKPELARLRPGIAPMPSRNLGQARGTSELALDADDRTLETPAWLPEPLQKMLRTRVAPAAVDARKPEPVQELMHPRIAHAAPDGKVPEPAQEMLQTRFAQAAPDERVAASVQRMLQTHFAQLAADDRAPASFQQMLLGRFAPATPGASLPEPVQQVPPMRFATEAPDTSLLEAVEDMPQTRLAPRPAPDSTVPEPSLETGEARPAGRPASDLTRREAIESDLEAPGAFDGLILNPIGAAQRTVGAKSISAKLPPQQAFLPATGAPISLDPLNGGREQPAAAIFAADPASGSLSKSGMPPQVAFEAEILAGADNGLGDSAAHKSHTDELPGRRSRLDFVASEQHANPAPGVTATTSRQKPGLEKALAAADTAPPTPAAPAVAYGQTPSGSVFTIDGAPALKSTPKPAATLLDHGVPNEPGTASQPVRAVTVKLHSEEHGAASVLLADRAGRVQVTVRAADPALVSSLQGDLDSLRQGLESQGLQVSLWKASSRGYDERTGRENAAELQRQYEADQGTRYQQHPNGGRRQNWHHEDEFTEID